MLDSERNSFAASLDKLADMLRVSRLEDWQKDRYFNVLKRFAPERYWAGLKELEEHYRPRSKNDFPVIQDIVQVCEAVVLKRRTDTWDCRCADCSKPFPAGTRELKCDCNYDEQCASCDRCRKHCHCGHYEDMRDRFIPEIFEQCQKLLSKWQVGAPSARK